MPLYTFSSWNSATKHIRKIIYQYKQKSGSPDLLISLSPLALWSMQDQSPVVSTLRYFSQSSWHPFPSDHFQHHPTISFMAFERTIFFFWDIPKHFLTVLPLAFLPSVLAIAVFLFYFWDNIRSSREIHQLLIGADPPHASFFYWARYFPQNFPFPYG